ncbi:GcrA family cell cycle regulator [Bradyrhizobium sp. ISRA442]|uniref:GcrA family cell cycle regulator n=1 Tax=Bradyrhizobium sp. ISRA442 TaxID=2866197 RepID=UPI00311AFFDA
MEPGNWTSEHSDALRDYFLKGMSYAEIGREINSRFGTAYTRNAVVGRAKRLGLAAPSRMKSPSIVPTFPGEPCPFLPRPQALQSWSVPPKSATKPAGPVKLRCVGIKPRLISLLELTPGDCRYPYGGDKDEEEITFCGHPRQPGASYCTPHFHLTRGPGTGARATGPVVLRLVSAA